MAVLVVLLTLNIPVEIVEIFVLAEVMDSGYAFKGMKGKNVTVCAHFVDRRKH